MILKGNQSQDIFYSDKDRYYMCYLLQEGIEKYDHRIHAFCFMRNHIHLLVQMGNVPLSKLIHNLSFRYTQKINRKHIRIGHLFHGRYKAILVQDAAYFSRLLRYIHRNPVRAHITEFPENYKWSSHNAYLGNSMITWLTKDYGLLKFGVKGSKTLSQYAKYISEIETDEELDELRGGFKEGQVLGDDDFLEMVRSKCFLRPKEKISIESIAKAVSEETGVELDRIVSQGKSHKAAFARSVVAKIAVEEEGFLITTLAKYLKRDPSTISGGLANLNRKYNKFTDNELDFGSIRKRALKIQASNA